MNEADKIADKWVKRLGLGFHPDTRGADYSPDMSSTEAEEYASDMEKLFQIAADPYAVSLEAMERAGLCGAA